MNNNNSVSGGQQQSSCGSQLDFISYWADKTVEKAVLQGQQLRQEKLKLFPIREVDVVNIDYIKPPRSMKKWGYHRKKSPKKFTKRLKSRSNSPSYRETSPAPMKMAQRQKCRKPKTNAPCAMRIAELAVPTKRQCLDTWRNKCNTLPSFMIERLRQHVLDQKPVVQISDAIYCFKRKGCKKQKNAKKSDDNATGRHNTKIKKSMRHNEINEVKILSAIFGHKIAKKLYKPQNIKLNSDLEKLAYLVSYDITKLMCKSKKCDMNNLLNKSILKDIAEKVTIWISDILDETTYKVLEDQLRDFEDEAGPALDCVDDLVDNVLDICVQHTKVFEEPSTSESDEAGLEEDILEEQTLSVKAGVKDPLSLESVTVDTLPETDVYENIEDHFKYKIVTIINNIDKDTKSDEYLDVDDAPDWETSEDVEAIRKDDYLDYEGGTVWQPSEDTETKDNNEHIDEDFVESEDGVVTQPIEDAEAKDNDEHIDDDFVESEDGVIKQPIEDEKGKYNDELIDEDFVESEDGVVTRPIEDAEAKYNNEHIDEDFVESEDGVIKQSIEDVKGKDNDELIDEDFVESEDGVIKQSIEDVKGKDNDELIDEDFVESEDGVVTRPIEDAEAKYNNEHIDEDFVESEHGVITQPIEDVEAKDNDEHIDEDFVESEDGVVTRPIEDEEAKYNDEHIDEDFVESKDGIVTQAIEDAEAKDNDENIDEDYVESEDSVATQPIEDAEAKHNNEHIDESFVESEHGVLTQPIEDAEAKDNDEHIVEDFVESEDGVVTRPIEDAEAKDNDENIDEDYVESEDSVATQPKEDAEAKYTDENYVEPEDGVATQSNKDAESKDFAENYVEPEDSNASQPTENEKTKDTDINGDDFDDIQQPDEMSKTFLENADNLTEMLTDAIVEIKNEGNLNTQLNNTASELSDASSDENYRKVTFTRQELKNNDENPKYGAERNLDWKASVDRMEFAAPNQDLLSDADESWPEEIQLPVIRPSQSVSKSITSLGKINEVDEKSSILPEKDSQLGPERESNPTNNTDPENQEQANNDNEETATQPISDTLELDIEERTKFPAEIEENFSLSVLEPVEPLETTSEHGEKVSDQLPKEMTNIEETVKYDINILHLENNTTTGFTGSKETRISESKLGKRPGKKATSIVKPKTTKPRKSKTNIEIASAPIKRLSKKENTIEKDKDRTATSKAKGKDIETAGPSQSVKDLGHVDVEKANDVKRVKPKPDYRVHVKTAPAWIKRNYGVPSCSCVNIPSKCKVKREMNENEIRRWCRDLEQGYENLKMWNEWVDTTSRTISVLHQEIGGLGGLGCTEKCTNKEWMKLKRHIDKDAVLWKKLNLTTRERLRWYKKIYQKQ